MRSSCRLRKGAGALQPRPASSRIEGRLNPSDVVDAVREAMPREAIATADVGSHKLLVGQGWTAHAPRSVLMSNGLSSMGYSLPAAIVAKLLDPARAVVCFIGDGGLAMVQGELRLAASLGLDTLVVVFCNGSLNRIEIKQTNRNYPSWGTLIEPTDPARLAPAMGCEGVMADSSAALERVLAGARIDPAKQLDNRRGDGTTSQNVPDFDLDQVPLILRP